MTTKKRVTSSGSRLLAWCVTAAVAGGLARAEAQPPAGQESARDRPAAVGAVGDRLPPELKSDWERLEQSARSRDWPAAERAAAALSARAPNSRPVRILQGVAMAHGGRAVEGYKIINAALRPDAAPEELMSIGLLLDEDAAQFSRRTYLNRALNRAQALDYEHSVDPDKLAVFVQLGTLLNLGPACDAAVSRFVEQFPNRADAHFYKGVAAAVANDWVVADDELHRALELGMPREVVESVLADGVSARASTWRYIALAPWAALAWVLGLALLFMIGKALSAATLHSVQNADPNLAVAPLERVIRRIYRVIVSVAGLYYYISIPFVIAIALAAAAGSVYAVFHLPRIPVKAVLIVVCFAGAMLMMIWACLRSLFVRIRDEDPGRALSESDAPGLWALAREVASEVGTRPVDVIYLTPGCDMAVFERGRAVDKARDRAKRSLILGLGVVDGFGLDAFRAVLAHEYGHFLHRDTAGGDVALRVNATMGRFAMSMFQQGNAQWWNVGWQFVRFYHWFYRRITHGASRLQEINADRVAALAYGKRAFEAGLRHVIRRDLALRYQHALSQQRVAKVDEPEWALTGAAAAAPANAFVVAPILPGASYLRADVRRQIEVQVDAIWSAPTTEDDTHPSPVERVGLLDRLRSGPESPGDPARSGGRAGLTMADLFADPGRLQAEQAEQQTEAMRMQEEAQRADHRDLLKQFDAYIAENPTLPDPIRDRASLLMQMSDYPAAIVGFTEAIERGAAQQHVSYYSRGVARCRLGRFEEAAADFREAMRLEPKLEAETADGRLELGLALLRGGRPADAVPELTRAAELEPERLAILLRLAEAHLACGDHQTAAADYTTALRIDPACAEALAGRSVLHKTQGRLAESVADVRAALEIEPSLRTTCPTLADLAAFEPPGA